LTELADALRRATEPPDNVVALAPYRSAKRPS